MILRSITKHVRDQNWFAVGIDFLIVIVGVFIGIQVANWNESRIEQDQLSEQLEGLRAEMDSNLQRIAAHRAWSDGQFRTATALRTALASDPPVFETTEFNAQLLDVQNIRTFVPEISAVHELADSGRLRRMNRPALRDALARWQEALASVRRMDRDALIHRDDVRADYLSSSIAMAALLEHYLPAGQGIGAMRFDNDPAALAGDLRLDNFLAMRAAFGAGIPAYLDDLSRETEAVVALLANGEATR